jgi:23S rRNA (uracil1939-C5)-methyltransferase
MPGTEGVLASRSTGVTPIDQFLWSAHVETVATLEK